MATLTQKRDLFLTRVRTARLSSEVTYLPAAGGSLVVMAAINRTVFEVDRGDGVLEQIESRDFVVAASAFAADPVRGDRIQETQGGTTYIYEVMAPAGGQPARYADSGRTAWRIHTKLVGKEASK